MTVRFMENTPTSDFEIEMQRIPGFRPRGRGIVVSCCEKNETGRRGKEGARQSKRCFSVSCNFGELMEQFAMEVAVSPFVDRVSHIAAKKPSVFFLAGHRGRFERLWEKHGNAADEDAMCAAVYLLSADPFLWGKAYPAVDSDIIRFQEIVIRGVGLDGYVLLHTAKDLYKGTCHLSLSELIDPELVGDDTFRLVISAFLIRRYGPVVLSAAERKMSCRV